MAIPHARPGQVVGIVPLGDELPDARTVAIIKSEQLEVMRVVLPAGQSMPEHRAPGEVTVIGIEGRIELTTPSSTQVVAAGEFVLLPAGEPHALRAVDDASALVTMCLVAAQPGPTARDAAPSESHARE